jgi:putative endonuclease
VVLVAYLYIVRCADGSLYTGIAADIQKRMKEHLARDGRSAKYTRAHPIEELAGLWRTDGLKSAARLEWRVKQLPREKKLNLLAHPELMGTPPYGPPEGIVCEVLHGVTLKDCLAGIIPQSSEMNS